MRLAKNKSDYTKYWEKVDQQHIHIAGGSVNWYNYFGKNLTLSHKVDCSYTLGPSIPTPRYKL